MRAIAALTFLLLATACAHRPEEAPASDLVLEAGMFPHSYQPPAGKDRFRSGALELLVHEVNNGGYGTNIFADVTVRNLGTEPADFDPDLAEVMIEETGMTFFHVTKGNAGVTVPVGFNLASKTSLRPNQATRISLWFNTPRGDAQAKALRVLYGEASIRFPPGPAAAAPAAAPAAQ